MTNIQISKLTGKLDVLIFHRADLKRLQKSESWVSNEMIAQNEAKIDGLQKNLTRFLVVSV